ncbi:hypothetical protein Aperf_G00000013141 [Anoplocephala perfoliata]
MDTLRQTISRAALGFADLITPVLKESKFREEGVITPAEFVAAGDHLVHQCPTWHWASGEPANIRNYLPENKQYLYTKGVPCHKRFNQLFKVKGDENRVLEETENDDGWVDAGFIDNDSSPPGDFDQFQNTEVPKPPEVVEGNVDSNDDDDEVEDFDAFMQEDMDDEEDDQVVTVQSSTFSEPQTSDSAGDVLQTRTYDLYITYDKYYRTARFWLTGYDEHNKPLTEAQMFEDFSQDHVNKTITMEMHPHFTGVSMPSIHPCRQAELMKRLMDKMAGSTEDGSNGGGGAHSSSALDAAPLSAAGCGASTDESQQKRPLGVHQYLMVFLKFVQSVIPTIDYDFTRNFKF